MGYEYLDHKSDVYVHAWGDSLGEAFASAAVATYEVMIDTSAVPERSAIDVAIDADDLEQLLYKWIDHMLYVFDASSFALRRAAVEVKAREGSAPSLTAKLYGDEYDPRAHGQRTGVKAMTYSLMKMERSGSRWDLFFVLDI